MKHVTRLILIAILLQAFALLPAKLPRHIIVGVNYQFPPYEYVDAKGHITGSNIDLLRALEKNTGLRFKFVATDWSAVQNDLESGRVMMLAGMIRTPERQKQFSFSIRHTLVYYSAFVRRSGPVINDWQDLNGKRILMESGSVVEELLGDNKVKARLLFTADFREAMENLSNGMGDVVILPKIQGYYYLIEQHLDNLMESHTLGDALPYCFALPLNAGELQQKLDNGLEQLTTDYSLRNIQNKWFGIYNSEESVLQTHTRYYNLLLFCMGIALLLLGFFLYRMIRRIRQQRKYLLLQMVERNNYEKEYQQRHQLFVSGPIVFLKWSDAKREMFESVSDNFAAFGYHPADLLSGKLKYHNIVHPDDLERVQQERRRHLEKMEYHYHLIYRIICPASKSDNEEFNVINTWHTRNHVLSGVNLVQIRWVFDYTVITPDDQTKLNHYYGYILDITGQKRIENELLKQHQATQIAINTKDIFLTSISIEINSPLNALIGLARKISDRGLTEEQKSSLQIITQSSLHLKKILQQIHDFLNILKGSIGSIPQWYVLRRLFEPVIGEFQIKIASKQLAFEYNEFQPAALVFLDADWFQKILRIILDNAVKFTEEGKIGLTVDIVRQQGKKDELQVAIVDTGVGIPAEKLQLIMEPFTQADETFTRKFGGIGLGLSIARNLVTQMNGTLHIESSPELGTRVDLHIPVETQN